MSAERQGDDSLDRQIRILTRRVVGAAPAAPDLEPQLSARSPMRAGGLGQPRRTPLLLAAAVVLVLAGGLLWRRYQQAPQPVATAGGPNVALRAERDGGGDVVTLVAGETEVQVSISRMITDRAPVEPICFGTRSSSPVCLTDRPASVSFGLLNPGQADAVLVVVAPTEADEVSVSVDGAVLWQHPIDRLVAIPVADLPAGARLDADAVIEIDAFDATGAGLAHSRLN